MGWNIFSGIDLKNYYTPMIVFGGMVLFFSLFIPTNFPNVIKIQTTSGVIFAWGLSVLFLKNIFYIYLQNERNALLKEEAKDSLEITLNMKESKFGPEYYRKFNKYLLIADVGCCVVYLPILIYFLFV